MFSLFIEHTEHVLLRQNFFGFAGLASIIAILSVALASQWNDLVVAIANHLLWLNFRNYRAMLARLIILVDVGVPRIDLLYYLDLYKKNIPPFNDSILQLFFIDFFIRLFADIACRTMKTLPRVLQWFILQKERPAKKRWVPVDVW